MSRYLAWSVSIALTLLSAVLALGWPQWWWGVPVFGALALVGTGLAAGMLDVIASSTLYGWIPDIAAYMLVGGMALDGRGIGGDENHGGGLPLPGQDPGAVVAGPPRQRQASGCQQAPRGAPHAPETMMAHF